MGSLFAAAVCLTAHVYRTPNPSHWCHPPRTIKPPSTLNLPCLQQNVEATVRYLDLVEALFSWLVTQSQRRGSGYDDGGLSGALASSASCVLAGCRPCRSLCACSVASSRGAVDICVPPWRCSR